MSEQTAQIVAQIMARLDRVVRDISIAGVVGGIVMMLALASGIWILAAGLEAVLWLEPSIRAVLLAVAIIGLLAGGVWFLLRPLLQYAGITGGTSRLAVARLLGQRSPVVADRLVNMIQLADGKHSSSISPMVDGALNRLGHEVEGEKFDVYPAYDPVKRLARFAVWPAVALLGFLIAAPGPFIGATKRLAAPATHFNRPAPFSLRVLPGDSFVLKGDPLALEVTATGREVPGFVTLSSVKQGEQIVEQVILAPDTNAVFRHTLVNVRSALRYRIAAGPVTTQWYDVGVIERPSVRSFRASLDHPAYSRIPDKHLEPNVGDITALTGTAVDLAIRIAGDDVTFAGVVHDDGRVDTLSVGEAETTGRFRVWKDGTYSILLRDQRGNENTQSIAYRIRALPDEPPSVTIARPDETADLDETLVTVIEGRLSDDYGFRQLELRYRLAESRFGDVSDTFDTISIPIDNPRQLNQTVPFEWDLDSGDVDPVPGDVIEYYLEVWDNDAITPYKSAVSATHRLRLPSLAEQYEALNKAQDEAENTLEDALREADEIKEQFEELRDELRRKPESDWEDKRQAEQILEKQQQMEEKVDEVARKLEDIRNEMSDNNSVSPETLELYEELQKVVEEINSPELQEALRKLQESLEQLNLQQLQESVEQFEFNEDQYKERLERALDLFKRLKTQVGLEEAARKAEELARQQEKLAEQTSELEKKEEAADQNTDNEENKEGPQDQEEAPDPDKAEGEENPEDAENAEQKNEKGDGSPEDENAQKSQDPEELARQQEMSSEEMKALEEKLRELREEMKELRKAPMEEMDELMQDMENRDLDKQMKENADELREGGFQKAREEQEQMQMQLQQMSRQLNSMQQNMQGKQLQVNLAGLRRVLSDVLLLSQQQEDMRITVDKSADDSPLLRQQARRQVELGEDLAVVSDTLQSLAREIPQMTRQVQKETGDALREMGAATEALTDRVTRRATGHQKGSMMHLNELALLLSDLLSQLMNQSGSGGSGSMQQMLQQLQQMSQQQQQLNQQMQQMLNDMAGQRMTTDMQDRLRQMAGQQEELRRQLRQISRSPELRGKTLGDLDKIGEEMEETIQELERRGVSRETIERQQRILTRLLDATRSMQERGQEERREGRKGTDVLRESPPDVAPSQDLEQLRKDLIRALESGYSPDYEELIKRYFELLQMEAVPR